MCFPVGIFNKLFGGKPDGIPVAAPVTGEAVALSQVSDPTFGEEILGKGAAIRPTEGKVYAPFDGTVDMMFDTGHAVNLISADGVELLVHVGLDTVKLKGEHYIAHVRTGDKVSRGQLLLEFDPAAIAAAGYDVITPVVVCNTADFSAVTPRLGPVVHGDGLLTLTK